MEKENKGGLAIAGLVLSIIAVFFSLIPIVSSISYVLGILAIIFGGVCIAKKVRKGMAIAALVIGIVSVVFAAISQQTVSEAVDDFSKSLNQISEDINTSMDDITGNNTDKILQNYCDVTIGKIKISKDRYGFINSELTVKVKNKSTEKKSFTIQIEAVKKDGTRIDTDYIYANTLNAGQSQSFKTFTYISDENYNAMKNASFKIVEVSMY